MDSPNPPNSGGLRCPNDDGHLRQVSAHARHGTNILLDQCESCGGLWFDKWELFQVDPEEARAIDSVDKKSLRFPSGSHEEPLCPHCRKRLEAFHDRNIPANIQMLSCQACGGFWLNHGEVSGYAAFRESRGLKHPDPKLAEEYEAMLKAADSDRDYWEGIQNFGSSLSGRRDPLTMLPLDGTLEQKEQIDRVQDAAYSLMGFAAKLLFGGL